MTKTHQALVAALLPFCMGQTKVARVTPATELTGKAKELRDLFKSETFRRYAGTNLTSEYHKNCAALAGLILGQDLSAACAPETVGGTNYPAGSVLVVLAGKETHKRVIGKGYLVASSGSSPTPLGIRGETNGRRFLNPAHVRPATDEEVTKTLAQLNGNQVRTLVCQLSAHAPWKEVLREVIENGGEDCRCNG